MCSLRALAFQALTASAGTGAIVARLQGFPRSPSPIRVPGTDVYSFYGEQPRYGRRKTVVLTFWQTAMDSASTALPSEQ